jgi:hypothetical protein
MAPPINRRSFHQQHIAVFVLLLVFLIIAVLFVLLVFLFVLLVVVFFLSSSFLPSVWFTFKFVFYENVGVGVCVCQQQNYLHLHLLLHRAFFLHYFSGWFVSQHFLKCQFGAEVVVVQQQQQSLILTHALTQANFYFRVMVVIVTILSLSLINQAELVPLF